MSPGLPVCVICDVPLSPADCGPAAPTELEVRLPSCARHAEVLRAEIDLLLSKVRRDLLRDLPRLLPGETLERVRSWAQGHGIPCARYGPVSREVLVAYRQAHGEGPGARADDRGSVDISA